ncbi:MAG: galactosyldiacylglycerol synthase [Chloroflexi bacterium]|nr:galactosyldiacylglycerol synthase [Chloroflexota bacterium]MBK7176731.1 galactosyldiacylglycerol synthase [Chloroflexota bacterium]MBP6803675.1 galactosyldiacylglycerol synthase [Chloroflexota bacterium]MBP7590558.1 galactosyldiacylglycerol synthase [Chloroflexota bacterium]
MIQLYNKETGALIGQISEAQLAFLTSNLEEEDVDDVDYYLNEAMIDLLVEDGADAALISLLRQAIDETGEVEFYWQRA